MTKDELRERILEALTINPDGLTRAELARMINPSKAMIYPPKHPRSLGIDLELSSLLGAKIVIKAIRSPSGRGRGRSAQSSEVYRLGTSRSLDPANRTAPPVGAGGPS